MLKQKGKVWDKLFDLESLLFAQEKQRAPD